MPRVETDGAHAPDQRFMLSLSRRAPHRKTPKITLIAAGSALALAGIAAASVAAWPGTAPAASADAASFAGAQNMADSSAAGSVSAAVSVHQLKVSEAAARQAALRQAIARRRARQAARGRAEARVAAARGAARAAARQQASATPAASAPAAMAPVTASGSPQQIARGMLGSYGWSASQFSCLQPLWNAESGWNASASNPSSGAYGIPQALPGSKMASAGADWQSNPATQIRWGLGYIRSVYGSPCSAWSHEEAYGWY